MIEEPTSSGSTRSGLEGVERAEGIERCWHHVFGGEKGLLHIWTARRGAAGDFDRATISSNHFPYPTATPTAAKWALKKAEEGKEVFFCAHLLTEPARLKENAAPVRTLWGDLDGCAMPNGSLKPTAVVESSPGRFHAYWRLDDAIPPEAAEQLNQRLAAKIGADPSGFDLSQLLRVPGTTNHKYEGAPTVELINVDASRSFSAAELDRTLPRPERAASGNPHGQAEPVGEAIANGSRNKTLTSIAGTLRRRGLDEAAIYAALLGINQTKCRTPLPEPEVRQIAKSVGRYKPETKPTEEKMNGKVGGDGGFRCTDLGNAQRFAVQHGEDVRYCHPQGLWYAYEGARWLPDNTGVIERKAKATVRSIYPEAADPALDSAEAKALASHAMRSEAKARIDAMSALARSEPGVPILPEDLDSDPWIINVQNGTVDLKTGELRPHRREDHITKFAPVKYDPDAHAPVFEGFLETALPSEGLRRFVQRFVGYSLTGDVSEQVLGILYGPGANGKSTLINVLLEVMGDYGKQAAPDLLVTKHGAHPTELADLFGTRLVAASETEDGRRLAEGLVKQLTGGDRIKARYMRQDFWEFDPTHKVWLATNHKPEVRGTDHAIWRRIKLIPFGVIIPKQKQDPRLPEKLRAELPGILRWCIEGCLAWQRTGLGEPEEVTVATADYRAEQDMLAAFFDERCVIREGVWTPFKALYATYVEWAESSGEKPENKRRFGNRLTERGFEKDNGTDNVAIRHGIALVHKEGTAGEN